MPEKLSAVWHIICLEASYPWEKLNSHHHRNSSAPKMMEMKTHDEKCFALERKELEELTKIKASLTWSLKDSLFWWSMKSLLSSTWGYHMQAEVWARESTQVTRDIQTHHIVSVLIMKENWKKKKNTFNTPESLK